MRAVFDVNVLIRFAFGSELVARLLRRAAMGEYTLLSGDLVAEELVATASKPRLASRLDRSACDDLLAFLRSGAEQTSVAPPFPSCRDPDDGYLLAMARDGTADFLVTNDLDLLSLATIGSCKILTPEAFAGLLDPSPP